MDFLGLAKFVSNSIEATVRVGTPRSCQIVKLLLSASVKILGWWSQSRSAPKPPGTQTRLAWISAGVVLVNLQTPFSPTLHCCYPGQICLPPPEHATIVGFGLNDWAIECDRAGHLFAVTRASTRPRTGIRINVIGRPRTAKQSRRYPYPSSGEHTTNTLWIPPPHTVANWLRLAGFSLRSRCTSPLRAFNPKEDPDTDVTMVG